MVKNLMIESCKCWNWISFLLHVITLTFCVYLALFLVSIHDDLSRLKKELNNCEQDETSTLSTVNGAAHSERQHPLPDYSTSVSSVLISISSVCLVSVWNFLWLDENLQYVKYVTQGITSANLWPSMVKSVSIVGHKFPTILLPYFVNLSLTSDHN